MALEQAIPFMLFAVVAAGTPGPANVLVAATAASAGLVRAVPCMLGVTVGTGVLLGAVALGLGAVVLAHADLLLGMKIVGAALLLRLAWKIATAGQVETHGDYRPAGFFTAAALQWVNPKSWIISVSAAGTYLTADSGNVWFQAAALSGLFVLAAIPACSVWLVFGAAMNRLLTTPRTRHVFNVSMGFLLAFSVVLVFL